MTQLTEEQINAYAKYHQEFGSGDHAFISQLCTLALDAVRFRRALEEIISCQFGGTASLDYLQSIARQALADQQK